MQVPANTQVGKEQEATVVPTAEEILNEINEGADPSVTFEPDVEEVTDEGVEAGRPGISAPVEEADPHEVVVQIDGEERRFKQDDVAEYYKGYLRQDDYTRKTQQLAEWYRQNEQRLQALQLLDTWMTTNPDKAARFHELMFGSPPPGWESDPQVQPQAPYYEQPQQVQPTYYEDYQNYPQYQDQAQYQQQVAADPYQEFLAQQQYQQQLLQQQQMEQWHAIQQQETLRRQAEDLALERSLLDLKQRRGDFNENQLLHHMYVTQEYNLDKALDGLLASKGRPAPKASARVESSNTKGASRGVAAQSRSGASPGPVRTNSWEEAAALARAEYGD